MQVRSSARVSELILLVPAESHPASVIGVPSLERESVQPSATTSPDVVLFAPVQACADPHRHLGICVSLVLPVRREAGRRSFFDEARYCYGPQGRSQSEPRVEGNGDCCPSSWCGGRRKSGGFSAIFVSRRVVLKL